MELGRYLLTRGKKLHRSFNKWARRWRRAYFYNNNMYVVTISNKTQDRWFRNIKGFWEKQMFILDVLSKFTHAEVLNTELTTFIVNERITFTITRIR